MTKRRKEIIAVRSLQGSDLGLFAAHRASATSKQRAIQINGAVAARILSARKYRARNCMLDCFCTFRDTEERSPRPLNKSQKNWRLGGKKLEGKEFGVIDSLDFALVRSAELNDGSLPVSMTFIARAARPKMHARISSMVTPRLKHNMAVYGEGDNEFLMLASLCPLAPPATAGDEGA
jgi:hypothetical protein